MQYVREIDIPRNRKKILDDIVIKHKITDAILMKSSSYRNPLPDKDIRSRIDLLRFLEEYIDTDNIIRIFNTRNNANLSSQIDADYIIEIEIKTHFDILDSRGPWTIYRIIVLSIIPVEQHNY